MNKILAASIIEWAVNDGSEIGLRQLVKDAILVSNIQQHCRRVPLPDCVVYRTSRFLCLHSRTLHTKFIGV